ncbi:MAG: hypothetical protein ACSHWN_06420 [Methylophilaceae bacterium]
MAIDKKTTSSINKTAAVKTTAAKRPAKTSRAAPRTKVTQPATAETKVTQTQVRKVGSPSVRNKASQKQLATTQTITVSKKKMERDSFTMPKDEYVQFSVLKKRLEVLGQPAKKSELLRAGVKLLTNMTDKQLKEALSGIPVIKTGRPKKKKS